MPSQSEPGLYDDAIVLTTPELEHVVDEKIPQDSPVSLEAPAPLSPSFVPALAERTDPPDASNPDQQVRPRSVGSISHSSSVKRMAGTATQHQHDEPGSAEQHMANTTTPTQKNDATPAENTGPVQQRPSSSIQRNPPLLTRTSRAATDTLQPASGQERTRLSARTNRWSAPQKVTSNLTPNVPARQTSTASADPCTTKGKQGRPIPAGARVRRASTGTALPSAPILPTEPAPLPPPPPARRTLSQGGASKTRAHRRKRHSTAPDSHGIVPKHESVSEQKKPPSKRSHGGGSLAAGVRRAVGQLFSAFKLRRSSAAETATASKKPDLPVPRHQNSRLSRAYDGVNGTVTVPLAISSEDGAPDPTIRAMRVQNVRMVRSTSGMHRRTRMSADLGVRARTSFSAT